VVRGRAAGVYARGQGGSKALGRAGFDAYHPNRARGLGMGLEVGKRGGYGWFMGALTRCGGIREGREPG